MVISCGFRILFLIVGRHLECGFVFFSEVFCSYGQCRFYFLLILRTFAAFGFCLAGTMLCGIWSAKAYGQNVLGKLKIDGHRHDSYLVLSENGGENDMVILWLPSLLLSIGLSIGLTVLVNSLLRR